MPDRAKLLGCLQNERLGIEAFGSRLSQASVKASSPCCPKCTQLHVVALGQLAGPAESYQTRCAQHAGLQAEKAVERFEEAGAVLGDLGMALIRLAKFEAEQGAASAGYSATAAASRSLAADCQRTGKVRLFLFKTEQAWGLAGQLSVHSWDFCCQYMGYAVKRPAACRG